MKLATTSPFRTKCLFTCTVLYGFQREKISSTMYSIPFVWELEMGRVYHQMKSGFARQWQPTPVLLPGESQGHALEKETATHSSVLAWRISGTGEPGGLPSLGLHRVGHD